ncbi:ABC transporter substrate-binding protein, partial [Vibrio sp. 1262-1]
MNKNKLMSAAALLASMVSTNVLAAEKELTLMLDWFVNPNHGPIVIAQERGYFKQQGLKVNIQEPADPSTPPKLVAAGKVDMAISYQPSLTIDVAAGLPLIRSATLIATPLNTLMVLDNGKNDNLGDLKGKKIGIAIAGNEEATIGTMLAQENVKFSDVQIINVGWALSSSLASG